MNDVYCNYCKVTLPVYKFSKNRKDKLNKSCDECRVKQKKVRDKNKCEHKREKSKCKECGGGSICEHQRIKSQCKECGGGSICEHNRIKTKCKECGGGSICEHKRIKSTCKECGGSQICEHNRRKPTCKECCGGGVCEHNRQKSQCKECGGISLCEHNRQKSTCKICDPVGHLSNIVRVNVRNSLKNNKELSSKEYLGCNVEELKMHIENQFHEGMTWDNYGEWHIDHIVPLKYENPTLEETIKRLHFSNTQPLWAKDNIAKGNRFIG